MTRPRTPEPGAGPAVERYLAEVTARLPGPARAHAGIVAELRSGLMDAQDAQQSAGLPPGQAGAAAISEFGDPAQIADAFRPELAATQARRVVVMLLVTGPLVGLLWIAEAMAGHLGIHPRLSWQWAGLSPGFRLVAVAVGVTACAALAGIAATGRAFPLAARRAAPRPGRGGDRRVRRDGRGRARPGAARGPDRYRPGGHLPGPGRRGGRSQSRPPHARRSGRPAVPGHPREPGLSNRGPVT